MFISTAWAQDAAANTTTSGLGILLSYAPIILIFVVFYFLVLRPQSQQARTRADLLANLKTGTTVVLLAGFVGVIRRVLEKEKLLEVEILPGGQRVWMERSAVERVWDDKVALPKAADEPVTKKR